MGTKTLEVFESNSITDAVLQEAAKLFSENYGVWGHQAAKAVGPFAKPGSRVKMSTERLRAQCLPPGSDCSYVRITIEGHLAANAFACRWKYNDEVVCWVTQLVVDRNYRERGLASYLLNELRRDSTTVYGIASSHPVACLAAANKFED